MPQPDPRTTTGEYNPTHLSDTRPTIPSSIVDHLTHQGKPEVKMKKLNSWKIVKDFRNESGSLNFESLSTVMDFIDWLTFRGINKYLEDEKE